MLGYRNPSGRPLSSAAWLEAHHRAKLIERTRFAERLAKYEPTRVVDLGCASGLWLELLDAHLPPGCELVGVDSDSEALAAASLRSERWTHKAAFELCDVQLDPRSVPSADLTLVFNLFSYLDDPGELLAALASGPDRGIVSVRQYDGGALRFGPMDVSDRALIEGSLRASVGSSEQFRHYDMDRAFELLYRSPFDIKTVEFELFERISPYPSEFLDYYDGSIRWTLDHVSEGARAVLLRWMDAHDTAADGAYFFEVDLASVLS